MPAADDFLFADNWLGSYYELAMQIGPRKTVGADDRLRRTLQAVWDSPSLEGCYVDRHVDPRDQFRVEPRDVALSSPAIYGWANVPSGRMVCVSHIVREEGDAAADWIDLCLPTGALGRIEPRLTFPIGGDESRSWREPLDAWFAAIAQKVALRASFRAAIIGEEVSGRFDIIEQAASRTVSLVKPTPGGVEWLPPERW